MNIFVNGKETSLEEDSINALSLMNKLGYTSPYVALAINETFVPKSDWESYNIKTMDRIEVLSPMAGG